MKEAWLEINPEAICRNTRRIIEKTKVDLIAVVKANGYGHGITQAARACQKGGAKMLAVASLNEALRISEAGIKLPVLVFNWVPVRYAREFIDHDFIFALSDVNVAKDLNEEAKKLGRVVRANLSFDTGMHRFGLLPEDLDEFLEAADNLTNLDIEGAYSHFSDADNISYRDYQLNLFNDLLFQCSQGGRQFQYTHMGKSSTLNFDDAYFDMTRCGLALYGATKIISGLEPALEFKTIILSIKKVGAGEKVGYEQTFTTTKPTTLAVLAVGFSDGYNKRLSNKGEVLVNYKKCPVVGKVCMNHTIIDVTGVPAKIGDEVTLIGKQGEAEVSAEFLANQIDTSAHEIIATLPSSLERVYFEENAI